MTEVQHTPHKHTFIDAVQRMCEQRKAKALSHLISSTHFATFVPARCTSYLKVFVVVRVDIYFQEVFMLDIYR